MSLADAKEGMSVLIKKIESGKLLKSRLNALGVTTGVTAKIAEKSLGGRTIKISIGSFDVALRRGEAAHILVEEVF